MAIALETLKAEYLDNTGRANRLKDAVFTQFGEMLNQKNITLGVPMESRLKSWASIEEKIERKTLNLNNVSDLDDLIGVRAILLFRGDVTRVDEILKSLFEVISSEDTSTRLGDSQFGYQSQHYIVQLPQAWLKLPTMSDLGNLRVEIQVRTLAQHIWAAASHKLQYKNESSVPPPLRRAIHRVSALLETVDLEFDRLLDQRQQYIKTGFKEAGADVPLNVDSLALILADVFPEKNLADEEKFSELLTNLVSLGINSEQELRKILIKQKDEVLKQDSQRVAFILKSGKYSGTTKERIEGGVFYTHVGLARTALRQELGAAVVDKVLLGERNEKLGSVKTSTTKKVGIKTSATKKVGIKTSATKKVGIKTLAAKKAAPK